MIKTQRHSLDPAVKLIYGIPDHRAWRRLEGARDIDLQYHRQERVIVARTSSPEAERALQEAIDHIEDEDPLTDHRGDGHTEEPVLGTNETVDVQLDLHQLHRDRRQARKEEDVDNWYYVGEVCYLGRTIAKREQWDEPVEYGEGVSLISGGCPAEGPETGSYDRPDCNPISGTTVIVQDVPTDLIDEDDPYIELQDGLTATEQQIVEAFNGLSVPRQRLVHERLDQSWVEPPITREMLQWIEAEEAEQAVPA